MLRVVLWFVMCFFSVLSHAMVLPEPREVAPFTLTQIGNKPFTQKDLLNHWSLLFFGFTRCQMICPTSMSELNTMYNQLEKVHSPVLPQVIFISLDPDRENIEQVNRYVTSFNKHFLGLVGKKHSLDALTKQLGVLYMPVPVGEKKGSYIIDHSGSILAINPKGQWYAVFTMPHQGKQLAKSFQEMIK